MKKTLSLVLALIICLGCVGWGGPSAKGEEPVLQAQGLPDGVQMYVPGTTIETDFGCVTILDAAFTTKAQIYYMKSVSRRKTTINGKTTESTTETIRPGYLSNMQNKMIFALKTVMTNTTGEDIEIPKLAPRAAFGNCDPIYFTKGSNHSITDEAYTILPAGGSSEIILAGLLPVEQYLLNRECLFEISGASLGFSFDSINVYNALGYQEGDNVPVSIEDVIVSAMNAPAPTQTVTETKATETEETEPPIQTFPGTNKKDGTAAAEGRAVKIENVSVGFRDQLPSHIRNYKNFSYYSDELTLNETQVYSVVHFTATNLTTDTIDLADLHGDFMVQLTYGGGYQYSTHTDVYALFESGVNLKQVRKHSSYGPGINVTPLASADVTVYIPCARKVAEDAAGALSVTFVSKYSGNESIVFTFDRS